MIDRLCRWGGSGAAILMAVSFLFIGKVVALDSPNSPLTAVLAFVKGPAEADVPLDDTPLSVPLADQPATKETSPAAVFNSVPHPDGHRMLHHLVVDEDGAVTGTLKVAQYGASGDSVVPAAGASVKLITHCSVSNQTTTDETGYFRLADVRDGLYSLVADGPAGVLVMRVSIESRPEAAATPLNALLVPSADAHYVRTMIQRHLPEKRSLPEYLAFHQIQAPSAPPETPLADTVSSSAKGVATHQLNGQLFRLNLVSGAPVPISDTSVELVRNGRGVTPMRLQPDGRYAAGTLEAEHYSLVACGPDGICAVGVEVGSDPPAPPPPPSEPYEDPYYMELAVAPIDVCGEIVESEILEECPPEFLEPLPCFDDFGYGGGGFAGGGGGGFAGGGGHGFGTGGWGALLGLAGLAGLAALADDDDDGGRQPATPYRRSPTVDSDTESPETETPADESPADESPDGETPDPESEALETGSPGLS